MNGLKIRTLAVAVLLAAGFAGCASRVKNVTSLPAGVTQKQAQDWDAAVANLHKIAVSNSTLRQTVIAIRNAGAFPDDGAYATALQTISTVDQLELASSAFLRQSPQHFGDTQKQQVAANVKAIAEALQSLNTAGATHIKDASSLQQVNGLIANLAADASLILALTN